MSLATDSLEVAQRKVARIWPQLVEAWEAKLAGQGLDGERRMRVAQGIARRRGFQYLDIDDVVRLPRDQLLARIDAVADRMERVSAMDAEALLGLVKAPKLTVSKSIDAFYEVAADRTVGKSADQLRRHRAPRLKAINNWIQVNGDLELAEITTDHWFAFRHWWLERVARGEVLGASANKDFTYLAAMWRAVARAKNIRLQYSTEGIALTDSQQKRRTRLAWSDAWIKSKLLGPGALTGLNGDARYILLGMINTGYRPSEGAGLCANEVRLDADIPHILIQPNENRTLKNPHSERYIPLTGVSLDAFRNRPSGFPRYASNSASLSATVNKFLSKNKLLETPRHTLYGLRHSFEDRLLMGGVDERVRRDLMGHGLKRERYGRGGDMSYVYGLMLPLAL